MSLPSVTYTFSAGSSAVSAQVNQNFTDLINAMTDTSKDFSINNLTLAGHLTGTWGSAAASLSAVGYTLNLIDSRSGDDVTIGVRNSNAVNSASGALYYLETNGASAGDVYLKYSIAGVQTWVSGIDNSDSDKYKIGTGVSLGSNDLFTLTILGSCILGNAALLTTATDGFLYIESCAGTPTGVPTSFSGRVPMVFDSSNNKIYFYNGSWKGVTVS